MFQAGVGCAKGKRKKSKQKKKSVKIPVAFLEKSLSQRNRREVPRKKQSGRSTSPEEDKSTVLEVFRVEYNCSCSRPAQGGFNPKPPSRYICYRFLLISQLLTGFFCPGCSDDKKKFRPRSRGSVIFPPKLVALKRSEK